MSLALQPTREWADVRANFDLIAADLVDRRVRGTVDATGAVIRGAGFSVVKTGTGLYTVTFTKAFSATPSTIVSPSGTAGANAVKTASETATAFNVSTYTTTTGANLDCQFSFIAIGSR